MPGPGARAIRSQGWFDLRLSWSWFEHVYKSTLLQDHAALGALLRPMLATDGVAIDIGAHGGQLTRMLADLLPHGHVVAVEPSAYARSVLRTALLLRRRRNVTVVATALGAAPGIGVLTTPLKRRGAMGYGLASMAPPERPGSAREVVPITTLDALAEAMALPRVALLKLDVEGYEAAILTGAAALLDRDMPLVLLEVGHAGLERAGSSVAALWELLIGRGYSATPLEAGAAAMADGDWLFRPPERRKPACPIPPAPPACAPTTPAPAPAAPPPAAAATPH